MNMTFEIPDDWIPVHGDCDLSNKSLGVAEMAFVCTYIQDNDTITSINLSGNQIGSLGAKMLATSLYLNTSVERLLLEDCNIGDEGIATLAPACTFSSINQISLSNNPITAMGIAAIAATLKTSNLQTLILQNIPVTDKGALALSFVVKHSALFLLDLTGCLISEEKLQNLRRICYDENPNRRILLMT